MRKAIEIDGGEPAHRVSLAFMLESSGKSGDAEEEYANAFATPPELVYSLLATDLRAKADGRWRRILDGALRINTAKYSRTRNVIVLARLGPLYLAQGDTGTAIKLLELVTSRMPQLERAWTNLGYAYLSVSDLERAEQCFVKALTIDPGDIVANTMLADSLTGDGRGFEAVSFARNAKVLTGEQYTLRAGKVLALYKTHAIVRDDLLPNGLGDYCSIRLPLR